MSKKTARDSRSERAAAAIAEQQRRERRRQGLIVGGIVLVLLAIVVALFLTLRGSDTTGDEPSAEPAGLTSDGYGVLVGEEDAPLEVTIYEDFQCPVCAQFEAAVADDLAAAIEDGRAKVDYRLVSFLDPASLNDYSSRALNAAMAVLDTGGEVAFVEFHRTLMENQPEEGTAGPDDDQLVEWAVEAGADEGEVRPLIEDKAFEQWGVNATDQMSQEGVTGTPTVFLNGEPTENPGDAIQKLQEALAG